MADAKITLREKVALIVSERLAFQNEISALFLAFGIRVEFVDPDADKIIEIAGMMDAALVLVESESPISAAFPLIRGLRNSPTLDLPIFMVTNRVDPQFDSAYFEGVDAIFVRPFDADEFFIEAAASYMSGLDGYQNRKSLRKRVVRGRVRIDLGAVSSHGYATNLSEGGMFVGSMETLPSPGQKIEFDLLIDQERKHHVTGSARVRWVRGKMEFGRPRGFGVQFESIDLKNLKGILDR